MTVIDFNLGTIKSGYETNSFQFACEGFPKSEIFSKKSVQFSVTVLPSRLKTNAE